MPINLFPYHYYKVYGLNIRSSLEFIELTAGEETTDVTIDFGTFPDHIENPVFAGVRYEVGNNQFLLKVDGVARFLVEKGQSIVIDRTEGGSDNEIRLFLLGSAISALIHQRGLLPIHGSAVVINNQAVIFSGISGAGKSTLAAGFLQRGYKLLADDICVISLDETGRPIVHPGYPQMKLWADSMEKLGHKTNKYRNVRTGLKKYALPLPSEFQDQSLLLKGVYIISTKNTDGIDLNALKGIEKFNMLKNNTYRLSFLLGIGIPAAHFKHITAISQHCFVKSIERPSRGFHLGELMDAIERDVKEV